jgi:hypothetical protein
MTNWHICCAKCGTRANPVLWAPPDDYPIKKSPAGFVMLLNCQKCNPWTNYHEWRPMDDGPEGDSDG